MSSGLSSSCWIQPPTGPAPEVSSTPHHRQLLGGCSPRSASLVSTDHSSHILPKGNSGPLAAARFPLSLQHTHAPKGFCISLFLKMISSVEREWTKISWDKNTTISEFWKQTRNVWYAGRNARDKARGYQVRGFTSSMRTTENGLMVLGHLDGSTVEERGGVLWVIHWKLKKDHLKNDPEEMSLKECTPFLQ